MLVQSMPYPPAAEAAAVMASGYLPAVTTAPYAAYGAQRVVAGYAGPLFQLRRASDGATFDVSPYGTGDFPDYTVIDAWAAGASLTVAQIYDQTGNARHLVQATVANQPSFVTSITTGKCVPILIDGFGAGSGGTVVAKNLSVSGLTLPRNTTTLLMMAAPTVSFNACSFAEFRTTANASIVGFTANAGQLDGASFATTVPAAQPGVVGIRFSSTGFRCFARAATSDRTSAQASNNLDKMAIGEAVGIQTSNGKYKLFSFALYNASLSDADAASVVAGLNTAHDVSLVYPYRVVFDGDSIMEGTGSSKLQNIPNRIGFTKNAEIFNTAVHGQSLTTINSNRAARFGNLYTASYPCVFFVQAGTNDIAAGTTGSALYTTASSLVSYLKGLGFKVVICTLLPRSGLTGAQETERQEYNGAVVGNAAAADLVLDLNADPTMGGAQSQASNPTYYGDGLHPTDAGYAILAPLYQTALQSVLRTTALGGGYVP